MHLSRQARFHRPHFPPLQVPVPRLAKEPGTSNRIERDKSGGWRVGGNKPGKLEFLVDPVEAQGADSGTTRRERQSNPAGHAVNG